MGGRKKGESVRWISEKEEWKEEKKLGKLLTIRAKSGQFLNIISFFLRGVETGIYTLIGGSKRVKERKKLQNEEKNWENLENGEFASPNRQIRRHSQLYTAVEHEREVENVKKIYMYIDRRDVAQRQRERINFRKKIVQFLKNDTDNDNDEETNDVNGGGRNAIEKWREDEAWGWKMIIFLLKEIITERSWLWGSVGGRNEWNRQWNENEKKLDDFRMCRAIGGGSEGM